MKKKVLLVCDFLEAGGGTRALINTAKALSDEYVVDILTGISEEPGSDAFLKEAKQNAKTCYTYPLTFFSGEFSLAIQCFWQISRMIIQRKLPVSSYDAICLNLTKSSLPFLIFKPFMTTRFIAIFHGLVQNERSSQFSESEVSAWPMWSRVKFRSINLVFHIAQMHLLNTVDEVICFSVYSQQLLKRAGLLRKTLHIDPPMYFRKISKRRTRSDFGIRDDALVILLTSRIEPRKGIHLVLQAAEKICKDYPHIQFYVLGANYNYSYFSQLFLSLRAKQLLGRFVFLGPAPHERVAELLAVSDLFVMPSTEFETLGFSTVEALYYGIPTIGFNSGATPELLNPIDTRLVATSISAQALERSIRTFIRMSPHQRRIISDAAHMSVAQKFEPRSFKKAFSDILESFS